MAATDSRMKLCRPGSFALMAMLFFSSVVGAAVLPEERTEALYHRYEGGGVTIDGPSVLVRKNFKGTVSLWGNYYVDSVTSASIDVLTQGSPYTEERTQTSFGADYLRDKTTVSVSYTESIESDYEAETVAFGVSQDFFGSLTTVSMGWSQGNDVVMRNGDEEEEEQFAEDAQHTRYNFGVTQILTKNWIVALTAETVVDEGYLNNPYRSVRYFQPNGNVGTEPERYPRTRNSDTFALRTLYYLPYRASVRYEYRTFSDSWGISSDSHELRYIHPLGEHWTLQGKYRTYSQTQADFYADIFPYQNAQTFLARDKEMSDFSDSSVGLGVSYEIKSQYLSALDKVTLNLYWDRMTFDYNNFRNATLSQSRDDQPAEFAVGEEPFYSFDADVVRFFLSVWY